MKEKFIVSIIDNNGIKQFNISRFIKKNLIYALIFIVVFSIVIFFSIRILADKLTSMQNHKDDTIGKYISVYNENLSLQKEIAQSQKSLDDINKKIAGLEDVISMKNAKVEVKSSNPFDISHLSSKQKEMILNLLPNSKPFSSEIKASYSSLKSGMVFYVPKDTPIFATADGIVDLTRDNDTIGIGKFVKISHSFGFISIYGHLSRVNVERGGIVKKGQIIGYSSINAGVGGGLFYDIRFLGSEVNLENFINWNLNNFDIVMNKDSIVNWDSLLWTFDDMMNIINHETLK